MFILSAFHHTFWKGQHKFLSFNLCLSQFSMSFSISWSFHFGQHVFQKWMCESQFLFPLYPVHSAPFRAFSFHPTYFLIFLCNQGPKPNFVLFTNLLFSPSFRFPAVLLMPLLFLPSCHFTDLYLCSHFHAGSHHKLHAHAQVICLIETLCFWRWGLCLSSWVSSSVILQLWAVVGHLKMPVLNLKG